MMTEILPADQSSEIEHITVKDDKILSAIRQPCS